MTKTVQKSKARDMTQGSIWKQLLLFSLPLMAGNLFQQLYNTVDSIVVGNFVGKEALAAVGSVGPIINSLIGFFMGLSTGAGVIISQYYGAKADEKVSRTVSTTLVMTFFLSICLYYSRHLHYTVHAPHDEYAERRHPRVSNVS